MRQYPSGYRLEEDKIFMKFRYRGVRTGGKKATGVIEAQNRQQAVSNLKAEGVYVLEMREAVKLASLQIGKSNSILSREIHFGPKVNNQEFALFARQFATLIQAGVPLAASIRVLIQQTKNKTFAKTLMDVASEVEEGNQLSQAVSKHSDIFPPLFVSMIRAAEASGNLDMILDRLALFFEREHYTREKVKSALVYPAVVTVLAVCVTIFLLIKVVPTFVSMFASFHVQLPLPTRIVLTLSGLVTRKWYIGILIVVLFILCYYLAVRREKIQYVRDSVMLHIPVFGNLLTKSLIARMARTLGLLLASSVPILSAIHLSSNVVHNRVLSRALDSCDTSLRQGHTLSEPLSNHPVFPPLVIQMIQVGEETGTIDVMLSKIADFYEAETEALVDRLKSLLEPMLMVILSVVVGTIVLAVIEPMFSLYQHIGAMS
jgi:type IV pilus assembly protein PilC